MDSLPFTMPVKRALRTAKSAIRWSVTAEARGRQATQGGGTGSVGRFDGNQSAAIQKGGDDDRLEGEMSESYVSVCACVLISGQPVPVLC